MSSKCTSNTTTAVGGGIYIPWFKQYFVMKGEARLWQILKGLHSDRLREERKQEITGTSTSSRAKFLNYHRKLIVHPLKEVAVRSLGITPLLETLMLLKLTCSGVLGLVSVKWYTCSQSCSYPISSQITSIPPCSEFWAFPSWRAYGEKNHCKCTSPSSTGRKFCSFIKN